MWKSWKPKQTRGCTCRPTMNRNANKVCVLGVSAHSMMEITNKSSVTLMIEFLPHVSDRGRTFSKTKKEKREGGRRRELGGVVIFFCRHYRRSMNSGTGAHCSSAHDDDNRKRPFSARGSVWRIFIASQEVLPVSSQVDHRDRVPRMQQRKWSEEKWNRLTRCYASPTREMVMLPERGPLWRPTTGKKRITSWDWIGAAPDDMGFRMSRTTKCKSHCRADPRAYYVLGCLH